MSTGLVLSGGGSKGAFQVGTLKYLIKKLGIKFDFISGVSTGALQGSMIAQNKIDELVHLWFNINHNKDIYKKHWWKIAFNKFPYQFTGLKTLLETYSDNNQYKIPFVVGVVDLNKGRYHTIKYPSVREILASCSIPILFEPIKTYNPALNEALVDGGVRNVTPLKEVISADCDTIYIITCFNQDDNRREQRTKWKFIPTLRRTIDIMVSEIKQNDLLIQDLYYANYINQLVKENKSNKRYIKFIHIEPDKYFMDDKDTLDFNHKDIVKCYEHGYQKAKEIVF